MANPSKEQKAILTPVQKATKIFTTAEAGFTKVLAEVAELAGTADDLDQQVLVRKEELAELDTLVSTGRRNAEADLAIAIKEDRSKVLAKLMQEEGLAYISKTEASELYQEVEDLRTDTEVAVDAAERAIASRMQSEFAMEIKLLESNHAQSTSAINASNQQLQEQNTFLKSQIEEAKAARAADQANAVAIEQARASAPATVINS